MLSRRRFLTSCISLIAAPAIVRASSLMPVSVRGMSPLIIWGDGIHDDTEAVQTIVNGGKVVNRLGETVSRLIGGSYLLTKTILASGPISILGSNLILQHDGYALDLGTEGVVSGSMNFTDIYIRS